MTATPVPPVSVADLDRLVARDHHDPHASSARTRRSTA